MADKNKNPEGTVIVLTEKKEVRATKKAKHIVAGEVYSLHPIAADNLIKKGYAEEVTAKSK